MLAIADNSGYLYKGFIKVNDQEFRLDIKVRDKYDLTTVKIFCDLKLKILLKEHLNNLHIKLKECETLREFLDYIERITAIQLNSSYNPQKNNCASVIEELEAVGWDKLTKVNASFDDISLLYIDAKERRHILRIQLRDQHPLVEPILNHQLPVQFDNRWNEKPSLKSLYLMFEKSVQDLQLFFETMNDLDTNCKVIEPVEPSLVDVHRRIAIESLVSIEITINPLNPRALPDIKFFGNEQAVQHFKESLYRNHSLWNPQERLSVNLGKLLEVELQKDAQINKEQGEQTTCSICLSFLSDDEIPDIQCSSKCDQFYHPSCIIEWLKFQPSTRKSFKVLFGKCPNCKQMLSVAL